MEQRRVSWREFQRAFKWRQGEHVTLLGPTGSGKTTLALGLLPLRSRSVIFASKPKDESLVRYAKDNGFVKIGNWPGDAWDSRLILWPAIKKLTDAYRQGLIFNLALQKIYRTGGWCVYLDELFYFTNILGLKRQAEMFWTQGRSLGITFVTGTQRPKAVPLMAYDQAVHLFFFRFRDESDLKRIGGIGWVDSREIRETVSGLGEHDFLYVNSLTGGRIISRMEVAK